VIPEHTLAVQKEQATAEIRVGSLKFIEILFIIGKKNPGIVTDPEINNIFKSI
jgi:hypothetical protein